MYIVLLISSTDNSRYFVDVLQSVSSWYISATCRVFMRPSFLTYAVLQWVTIPEIWLRLQWKGCNITYAAILDLTVPLMFPANSMLRMCTADHSPARGRAYVQGILEVQGSACDEPQGHLAPPSFFRRRSGHLQTYSDRAKHLHSDWHREMEWVALSDQTVHAAFGRQLVLLVQLTKDHPPALPSSFLTLARLLPCLLVPNGGNSLWWCPCSPAS